MLSFSKLFERRNSSLYYKFIDNHLYNSLSTFLDNDHKPYVSQAKKLVPFDKFKSDYKKIDTAIKQEFDERDYCIVRLLEWFKEDFFTWVDSLECEDCHQECHLNRREPTPILNPFRCSVTEIFRCRECHREFGFPRYNHAGKLLETRKGRCGEWARAFAFILFAFDYQVRMVYHYDDHVWCEFWSENKQRWIHLDPCENQYDNPLMYECGWSKQSSLIVAHGLYEVRDVTWRYSSRWRQTAQFRKHLFSEEKLAVIFEQRNTRRQASLSKEIQDQLTERWLSELVEFLRSPEQEIIKPEDRALKGRISGSLNWRQDRGECGSLSIQKSYVFKIPQIITKNRSLQKQNYVVTYDCREDSYVIQAPNHDVVPNTTIIEWKNACYECVNIFRMVEKDWKQCYLSRDRNSNDLIGSIRWRFEFDKELSILENTENWRSIEFQLNGATFESGALELLFLFGENFKREFYAGEKITIKRKDIFDDLQKETIDERCFFEIQARLMFGNGDNAWQHAQLFRQTLKTNERDSHFLLTVKYYDE